MIACDKWFTGGKHNNGTELQEQQQGEKSEAVTRERLNFKHVLKLQELRVEEERNRTETEIARKQTEEVIKQAEEIRKQTEEVSLERDKERTKRDVFVYTLCFIACCLICYLIYVSIFTGYHKPVR